MAPNSSKLNKSSNTATETPTCRFGTCKQLFADIQTFAANMSTIHSKVTLVDLASCASILTKAETSRS